MSAREVPFYPFSDYEPEAPPDAGVFMTRFETPLPRLNRAHWHRHNYYQFYWIDSGEFCSDFASYPIDGQSLVFASPGQIHQWKKREQMRGFAISFTQEFFDGSIPPPSRLLRHLYWFPADRPPILSLKSSPLAAEIEVCIAEIWREFQARENGYLNVIRAMLHSLFIRASRGYETLYPYVSQSRSRQILREFRLALESNVRSDMAVSDFAKILQISPERLNDAAQEHEACTPGDLIRQRLLLEAKRLLVHSKMNVSEIAYALNFKDPAYFGRFFRRLTGETPGAFREKHQV